MDQSLLQSLRRGSGVDAGPGGAGAAAQALGVALLLERPAAVGRTGMRHANFFVKPFFARSTNK